MNKCLVFLFRIAFISTILFSTACKSNQKSSSSTKDDTTLDSDEGAKMRVKKLQCGLNFSGPIDNPWKSITLNAWNKMIGRSWKDKGGHFLSQIKMKDRGEAAGIYTPSDLESEMRGGKIRKDPDGRKNRFECVLQIVNSKNWHFTIVYDYKTGTPCEFVTCLLKK